MCNSVESNSARCVNQIVFSISSMSFINTFIEIGRSRRNSGSSFIGIVLIYYFFNRNEIIICNYLIK